MKSKKRVAHFDNEYQREELKKALLSCEKQGNEIAEGGRKITEYGQKLADLSRVTYEFITPIPLEIPILGISDALKNWKAQEKENKSMLIDAKTFQVSPVQSTTGSAIYSSTAMIDLTFESFDDSQRKRSENNYKEFYAVVERTVNKENVIKLLNKLGLDRKCDYKNSLENFIIAHDSLEKTVTGEVDPAITSLIPMRESINTAIDDLLKMRPRRDNIPLIQGLNKEQRKIRVIAEQLKYDDIDDAQIRNWTDEYKDLNDRLLSPSKNSYIDRDEWIRSINKATIFLESFLSGIDPEKLRNI